MIWVEAFAIAWIVFVLGLVILKHIDQITEISDTKEYVINER